MITKEKIIEILTECAGASANIPSSAFDKVADEIMEEHDEFETLLPFAEEIITNKQMRELDSSEAVYLYLDEKDNSTERTATIM